MYRIISVSTLARRHRAAVITVAAVPTAYLALIESLHLTLHAFTAFGWVAA